MLLQFAWATALAVAQNRLQLGCPRVRLGRRFQVRVIGLGAKLDELAPQLDKLRGELRVDSSHSVNDVHDLVNDVVEVSGESRLASQRSEKGST